ncbi:MAG TPA: crossover junction endodeoxyribonuclease RuvC [Bacteroidia bacterium]|jgi:crossover junction endodeoxyribonuclease RuvC|nr:crossover junction endodeoxyribonuclease RuvC [Bacteroidia bacterium]
MRGGENKTDRIILGIDPGTTIMGYGLIKINGKDASLIHMDIISMGKLPNHFMKLKKIFEETIRIIEQYKPDEVALEAPFYAKNIQSMLKLGRAQGISMAAALSHSLPVFEYSPRKIKQSITGKGSSSKEQVAIMLQRILTIQAMPAKLDATDALAVAICHFFQNRIGASAQPEKKFNSWEAFISENKNKVSGL